MSMAFGPHMIRNRSDISVETQKKILDVFDEYVDYYRKEVDGIKLPPIYFPVLTKINGAFCVGDVSLYIFYEKITAGLPDVYFLNFKEKMNPNANALVLELSKMGLINPIGGFVLPLNILDMTKEERKQTLIKESQKDIKEIVDEIKYADTKQIVKDILNLQEKANEILSKEVFIDKYAIVEGILEPSRTFDEYSSRIQTLNLLFDKIRIDEVRKLIVEITDIDLREMKTIRLLECYLTLKGVQPLQASNIVDNLRDIAILSAGFPRHEGNNINKKVNEIMGKWGFDPQNINFRKLWKVSLEQYKKFLENFIEAIKD